jgi:hypothetical protein
VVDESETWSEQSVARASALRRGRLPGAAVDPYLDRVERTIGRHVDLDVER